MSFAAAAISAKNHGRQRQEKEKAQATRARGMTGKQKNLCKSENKIGTLFPSGHCCIHGRQGRRPKRSGKTA